MEIKEQDAHGTATFDIYERVEELIDQLVLCGDCLRVRDFTVARHLGEELCECGGEFCGCIECLDTIVSLRAGKRKAEEINCKSDVTLWNEHDGKYAKEVSTP